MANHFYIKQNDILPQLRVQVSDTNGYVDLTAGSAQFVYRNKFNNTGSPVERAMTLLGPTSGYLSYDFISGDSSNLGTYYAEIHCTLNNGKNLTFPNSDYIIFEVVPGLYT